MPIIINFPDRPKWLPYYWNCAKHFGEECYRTWKEELSFAVIVMFIAYLITRGPDTRAANDLQVALLSSGIGLGIVALWHLIRAPFLAHAEAVVGDSRAAVPAWYGIFGAVVLLGLIFGGVKLGQYVYAALPRARVEIVIKAPAAPVINQNTQPQIIVRNTPTQSEPTPQGALLPQPTTQLDKLIAIDSRLTKADREQLAAALLEFSQILDQANSVWGKANNVDTDLRPNDFETRKVRLLALLPLAQGYSRNFYQERQKWHYYDRQIEYIFGDNPDNDAAIIEGAVTGYLCSAPL